MRLRVIAILRITVALLLLGCINEYITHGKPYVAPHGVFTVVSPNGTGWQRHEIYRGGWRGVVWERCGIRLSVLYAPHSTHSQPQATLPDERQPANRPSRGRPARYFEKPISVRGLTGCVAEYHCAGGNHCRRCIDLVDAHTGYHYQLALEAPPYPFIACKQDFAKLVATFRPFPGPRRDTIAAAQTTTTRRMN